MSSSTTGSFDGLDSDNVQTIDSGFTASKAGFIFIRLDASVSGSPNASNTCTATMAISIDGKQITSIYARDTSLSNSVPSAAYQSLPIGAGQTFTYTVSIGDYHTYSCVCQFVPFL